MLTYIHPLSMICHPLRHPLKHRPTVRGEFPAQTLILAGQVRDLGQLSPTQRADLNRMVRQGRLSKVGDTYCVLGLRKGSGTAPVEVAA